MDTSNVALVQSLYAAFGKGDIAPIIAALTPDVEWEAVGRPSDFPTLGLRKGPAAVNEFFDIIVREMTFTAFTPKDFYAAGDKVFVLGTYSYTVKKTGRSATSDWVHIFTFTADGKIEGFRDFSDTARAAEAYRG